MLRRTDNDRVDIFEGVRKLAEIDNLASAGEPLCNAIEGPLIDIADRCHLDAWILDHLLEVATTSASYSDECQTEFVIG
jgi:hypothetical protein